MKNSIQKFLTIFSTLTIWNNLPAFIGWISLSCGIICANVFPSLRLPSLYNNILFHAIILSLLVTLICKNIQIKIIMFFLTGFTAFSIQQHNQDSFSTQLERHTGEEEQVYISGKVISTPLYAKRKYSFLLKADKLYTNSDTLRLHGNTFKCSGDITPPSYGYITCSGQLYLPHPPANPHAFNEYTTLLANNISGRFRIDTLLTIVPSTSPVTRVARFTRTTVLKTIAHVTNPALKGILQAAFLGEKNNLTPHVKSIFRDAGIYHLLAISGLHVAILISSIWLLLSILPIARVYKILSTILFIWCYLFFIGFIPSLFRAVIMATLILLSTLFQRNNHVINSLGVAGIIWLIMSPASLFTPGFQLSFAATFGIITLFFIFNRQLMPTCHNEIVSLCIKTFFNPFFVSCAGFIATLPIIVYYFGRISLYGLFANIFAVLLMGLAMNTFFAGIIMQMLWQPLALIIMRGTEFFLFCITGLAELSRFIPWASVGVPVPYTEFFIVYSLMVLGFAAVNRTYQIRYLRWMALCLFLMVPIIILRNTSTSYTEIVFFNANKNSPIGIRFPNRKIWLVSSTAKKSPAATYKYILEPWLRHHMLKKMDAILLPSVEKNVVHDLDPVCTNMTPRNVISCNSVNDYPVKENLDLYLNSLDIDHIRTRSGWQIIPAKACTCTVYYHENDASWYSAPRPAMLKLSCSGTQVFINSFNKPSTVQLDSTVIQIDNTTSIYLGQGKRFEFIKTAYNRTLSTEINGAVIVRIDRNGAVKVRSML